MEVKKEVESQKFWSFIWLDGAMLKDVQAPTRTRLIANKGYKGFI